MEISMCANAAAKSERTTAAAPPLPPHHPPPQRRMCRVAEEDEAAQVPGDLLLVPDAVASSRAETAKASAKGVPPLL